MDEIKYMKDMKINKTANEKVWQANEVKLKMYTY